MSYNGYLYGGSCVGDPAQLLYSLTCSGVSGATVMGRFTKSDGSNAVSIACYSQSGTSVTWITGKPAPSVSFDCTLPGSPLTETEQIQAINQFLPYALAFLAAIWGGKKVFDVLWGAAFRPRRTSDPE